MWDSPPLHESRYIISLPITWVACPCVYSIGELILKQLVISLFILYIAIEVQYNSSLPPYPLHIHHLVATRTTVESLSEVFLKWGHCIFFVETLLIINASSWKCVSNQYTFTGPRNAPPLSAKAILVTNNYSTITTHKLMLVWLSSLVSFLPTGQEHTRLEEEDDVSSTSDFSPSFPPTTSPFHLLILLSI